MLLEDEGRGVDFLLCGCDQIKNRSGVSVPPEQGRLKEETNSGSGDEFEAWVGLEGYQGPEKNRICCSSGVSCLGNETSENI